MQIICDDCKRHGFKLRPYSIKNLDLSLCKECRNKRVERKKILKEKIRRLYKTMRHEVDLVKERTATKQGLMSMRNQTLIIHLVKNEKKMIKLWDEYNEKV